jgi:hypothetical protein
MQVVDGYPMNINLKTELIDEITKETLVMLRDDFKNDLKKDKPLIFYKDPDKDKKEIKEHIKALTKIIKYFTPYES